ncbi:hypothetical protein [Botrimarina hoheduenensis]|uniref:Uncharacterized protein n=1 Tax=Botrimarina hoheduenensis TaxID=2528000 RepID=A0A5C5WDH8_9BACT|nr:hypothetical protein [Botrimarina hoheduenensis]TWT48744.1 hypothetical protein Pla111_05190 [Botrimarina hoheduenensis]
MKTINMAKVGLAAAMTLAVTAPASAFPGGCDYWGIGGLYRSLDYPTDRRVPYFAAHPPVYYSHPVPRTYGYSPFAYGPDVRTPDYAVPQPVEIVNPFVPSAARSTDSANVKQSAPVARDQTISTKIAKPAPKPLMIINPFVTDTDTAEAYH